jgi:hypothetical protein
VKLDFALKDYLEVDEVVVVATFFRVLGLAVLEILFRLEASAWTLKT